MAVKRTKKLPLTALEVEEGEHLIPALKIEKDWILIPFLPYLQLFLGWAFISLSFFLEEGEVLIHSQGFLETILPQPTQWWNYRHAPSHLASFFLFLRQVYAIAQADLKQQRLGLQD